MFNEHTFLEDCQHQADVSYRKLVGAISNYTYIVEIKDGYPWKTIHSEGCIKTCGYHPEDFSSDPQLWYKMVHPEDRHQVQEHIKKIFSEQEIKPFEHRILRKDGTLRWIKNTPVLQKNNKGQLLFYYGVIEDITERKQYEMDLSQFASIVESSEDAIIGMTLEGIVTSWNKGAEQIFKKTTQQALGQPLSSLIIPAFQIDYISQVLINFKETMKIKQLEAAFILSNEMTINVSMVISPIKNIVTGHISGISMIARDITDHKNLERLILETSDQERQKVGQDLHDGLCQQLVSIAYMVQILEKKLIPKSIPEISDFKKITSLMDQAIKMTRDYSRILAVDELESGGLSLALEALVQSIKNASNLDCQFIQDPSNPLRIEYRTAYHLYRIAQEAIQNVIKHSQAQSLKVSLTVDGEAIKLAIQDNGVGLNADKIRNSGLGLRSMHYRAAIIGASLDIKQNGEKGTNLLCSLRHRSVENN